MQKISSFDINQATPTLLYNQRASAQNPLGGIMSILFILFTLSLLILKSMYIFGYSGVMVESFYKNQKSELNISTGANHSQFSSPNPLQVAVYIEIDQQIYIIPPQVQKQFGIIVSIVKLVSNGTHVWSQDNAFLVACPNNTQKFCPPEGYILTVHNDIEDLIYSNTQKSVVTAISIIPCKLYDEECADVSPNMFYEIILNQNQFDVFEPETQMMISSPSPYRPIFDMPIPQDPKDCQVWSLSLVKVDISTDNNIVSNLLNIYKDFQKTQTWYCQKTKEKPVFQTNSDLACVFFQRSSKTEYYQRTYQRIDNALADISGIFGTLSLLLIIFCGHYNSWKIENYVNNCFIDMKNKNQISSNEQVSQQKTKINFKNYLKSMFKCFKFSSRQINQQKQRKKQELQSLDIIEIIAQVRALRRQVQFLKNKQKNTPLKGERINKTQHLSENSLLLSQKKEDLKEQLLP